MTFVDNDIHKGAASQFLMQAGGCEVHVARDIIALVDGGLADEVLCTAPLVGGNDILIAVIVLDGLFEMVKISAAGVSLIPQHDASPLAVAHGACSAVCEQVDVDILRTHQESIVAGFLTCFQAFFGRDHADGFHHLDLPRFSPGTAAELLTHSLIFAIRHAGSLYLWLIPRY